MEDVSNKRILLVTLAFSPIPLLLCLAFGGPYGSYFLFKVFYPYTMLVASYNHYITDAAQLIGLLQFPICGLVLVLLQRKFRFDRAFIAVFGIHVLAAAVAVKYVEGFS